VARGGRRKTGLLLLNITLVVGGLGLCGGSLRIVNPSQRIYTVSTYAGGAVRSVGRTLAEVLAVAGIDALLKGTLAVRLTLALIGHLVVRVTLAGRALEADTFYITLALGHVGTVGGALGLGLSLLGLLAGLRLVLGRFTLGLLLGLLLGFIILGLLLGLFLRLLLRLVLGLLLLLFGLLNLGVLLDVLGVGITRTVGITVG